MTPALFLDALAKAIAALIVIALFVGLLWLPAEPIRFTPILDVTPLFDRAVEVLR